MVSGKLSSAGDDTCRGSDMKTLHCYISSKRIKKENVGLLLSVRSDLVTAGEDKGELVSAAFASAFTSEVSQGLCTY